MSPPVVFLSTAREDFDAAVTWYEQARKGLGLEFSAAIEGTLGRIAEHPGQFRMVRGRVRRAVVKRFPFTVHFLEERDRIVVLAVFHGSRDPAPLPRRSAE